MKIGQRDLKPRRKTAVAFAGAFAMAGLVLALSGFNERAPGIVAKVHAQERFDPTDAVCSNATVAGSYGFQRHGTKTDGTLISSVGNITFDGEGNVTGGQEWTMRNGVLGYRPIGGGSYVVNPDCTGQIVDPTLGPISQLVVVQTGSELLAISLSAGSSVWARFERVAEAPGLSAIAAGQP